jgi:hypothetical protein
MRKRHMLPAVLISFIPLTACVSKPLPVKAEETAALRYLLRSSKDPSALNL